MKPQSKFKVHPIHWNNVELSTGANVAPIQIQSMPSARPVDKTTATHIQDIDPITPVPASIMHPQQAITQGTLADPTTPLPENVTLSQIATIQLPIAEPSVSSPLIRPALRLPTNKQSQQTIVDVPTQHLPIAKAETFIKRLRPFSLPVIHEERHHILPSITEVVTQKVQAISVKIQAVWSHLPYRVERLKVMNSRQELAYYAQVLVWIAVNLYFWLWWLQPKHSGNPILFLLMNMALLYEGTLLPSFYIFYLGNMRHPKVASASLATQTNVVKKVAVISLTVPGSESLEIVRRQLVAMTQIKYPHESWILVDKQHSPEIEALARETGVYYFSRHDVATWGEARVKYWNQPEPPFKAKTKAGNVNSWIDAYGQRYSHFTQLDIDHIPTPSYLHQVLGYFLDAKVKWVQAPSVYGNVDTWTARGSAEQEFVLQGPLQMGFYGFCNTPFIIGSHCTYDMQAIREIGGFQPTRAEDHLDTVFLAARGYEGVFLPEVIAIGDGPENFETYLAQQFAWAYSMIQVLFNFTPKRIKHYTLRQAIQFLFVQTWYVMWSLTMFTLFILPVVSLFFNTPIARVSYGDFMLHSLPITVTAFMVWAWSHSWHLPRRLELSWRGVILHIARWPVVLSALVQVILNVQKPYMITVKGLQHGKQRPFALRPHYPYLGLIGIALGSCWYYLFVIGHSDTQGYLLFALQGAAVLLLVYITALVKDMHDMLKEGISLTACLLLRVKPLLLLIGILSAFIVTAYMAWHEIYTAVLAYDSSLLF